MTKELRGKQSKENTCVQNFNNLPIELFAKKLYNRKITRKVELIKFVCAVRSLYFPKFENIFSFHKISQKTIIERFLF